MLNELYTDYIPDFDLDFWREHINGENFVSFESIACFV